MFYSVGLTPGPIGNPTTYHPITNNIQVIDIIKKYGVINLNDLNRFDNGAEVNPEILKDMGLVKKATDGIKVLGNGTLEKKLNIKANKFSDSAKKQIEDLGGKAEVI